MGNSHGSGKFFRAEDFSNDPAAFRVFVKKRNKFIPGWLKVEEDQIVFARSGSHLQLWPLAYLRRYGYTCAGVFFFESGRRCATGEGLHTFQSGQAERIFQVVQSKIKNEEFARSSRASSVASTRFNALNPVGTTRIHPVQRYSSEGAKAGNNNDFMLSHCPPPAYHSYHRDEGRSLAAVQTREHHSGRERPRSVASDMDNNILHPPLPMSSAHMMNRSYMSTVSSESPWPSQQQLEGEIVSEHVLSGPYRQALEDPVTRQRKYHSYVNVDFGANGTIGRELHRTKSTARPPRIASGSLTSSCSATSPLLAPSSGGSSPTSFFSGSGYERYANRAHADVMSASATAALSSPSELFSGNRSPKENYVAVTLNNHPMPHESQANNNHSRRSESGGQRSENSSAMGSPSVNYALIDFDKTKTLEQAALKQQQQKQQKQFQPISWNRRRLRPAQ
ncbi:ROG-1 protein [Aphelenchoides avenae]|nr:ROG-1 protein [Aphelenchus avenae]